MSKVTGPLVSARAHDAEGAGFFYLCNHGETRLFLQALDGSFARSKQVGVATVVLQALDYIVDINLSKILLKSRFFQKVRGECRRLQQHPAPCRL